jgi:hypothetical protein
MSLCCVPSASIFLFVLALMGCDNAAAPDADPIEGAPMPCADIATALGSNAAVVTQAEEVVRDELRIAPRGAFHTPYTS